MGLLFDSTIESVISDWSYDPQHTQKMHVDSRYILWLLRHYARAYELLEEIGELRH